MSNGVFFSQDPQARYKQQMALSLMQPGPTRNVGEGLSSAARQIMGALLARQSAKDEERNRDQFTETLATSGGNLDPTKLMTSGNPYAQNLAMNLLMSKANQKPSDQKLVTTGQGYATFDPSTGTMSPIQGAPSMPADNIVQDGFLVDKRSGKTMPLQDIQKQRLAERLAGKTSISNKVTLPENVQIGKIDPGYALRREGNKMWMEPIPGSKADQEVNQQKAAAEKFEKNREKYADVVTSDIDQIIGMADSGSLPITGLVGDALSGIPGTPQHDAKKMIEGVQSNITLDRLQELRDAAKAAGATGSGLGQVTERELNILQSSMGSLAQSQGKEQFLRNMKRVRQAYVDAIYGPGASGEGETTASTGPSEDPLGLFQ